MAAWPAMILAPLAALGAQALLLAAAQPACDAGRAAWLHAPVALAVLAAAVFTAWSARGWRHPQGADADTRHRHRVFAAVGLGVGAISTLAALATWWPLWVLSPCAR